MGTFQELPLSKELKDIIASLGFLTPTEIQYKAIPLLVDGTIDFHGQAQTGTGKTLAFGIPLLQNLDKEKKVPQALIVAPTRELAVQIYESLAQLGRPLGVKMGVLYGGVSFEEQADKLKRGLQIVIGTPGRINDHLRRKTLDPKDIMTLVLDEADIMLDMGFRDEIEELIKRLPKQRRIWLFSATVKAGIAALMKKHMQETISIRVTPKAVAAERTKQYYCIVPMKARLHAVMRFVQMAPDFYGFVFCQTKMLTGAVAEELIKRGYNAAALHGDLSQAARNLVIKKFKQRDYTILVATDVAARGIDVPDITHVINYSVPEDLESYIHRIGRTGRAGKEGIAITLINKSEQRVIKHLESKFNLAIEPSDLPSRETLIQRRLHEIPTFIASREGKVCAYFEELQQFLSQQSHQELVNLSCQLLSDKFLATLDLEEVPFTHVAAAEPDQMQEIYLDMGADDGVTRDRVRDYLLQSPVIKPEDIKTIRVIKRRTYVKLSADCSPDLVHSLRSKRLNGRKVRVRMTCVVGDFRKPRRRRS